MDGRDEIHQSAQRLLDIFIAAAETQSGGHPVEPAALRSLARNLLTTPPMLQFLKGEFHRLADAFALELKRRQRSNPLQRLVTHPLTEPFEAGKLSREILPNWFSFIHLVMGDDRVVLAERCADILEDVRQAWTDDFTWDYFYEDPRAKHVLWSVLVRIADSFRRFELRRDWFINLMQYSPQAVSLASNAFLSRPTEDGAQPHTPFGLGEFNVLFASLYGPMRTLSDTDQALFKHLTGAEATKLFGPLLVKLGGSGAPL